MAASGVTLYLLVITATDGMSTLYAMRAVYLAIAGYLIGFFGRQRADFEVHARELETRAERQSIARSLHDGYVQALAGVNLRLEACRELLMRERQSDALAQLTDLQRGVAREYDEVRSYIRSLGGIAHAASSGVAASDPRLHVDATFDGSCMMGEHVLQIMLEGLRNARRHARAALISIRARDDAGKMKITIDDDGVGFPEIVHPPWAIASRVAEIGGRLIMPDKGAAHLEIEMPQPRSA